jgi:hypothetical protein
LTFYHDGYFDTGYDCDFYATLPDPNVVATLLKMYLRERKCRQQKVPPFNQTLAG